MNVKVSSSISCDQLFSWESSCISQIDDTGQSISAVLTLLQGLSSFADVTRELSLKCVIATSYRDLFHDSRLRSRAQNLITYRFELPQFSLISMILRTVEYDLFT